MRARGLDKSQRGCAGRDGALQKYLENATTRPSRLTGPRPPPSLSLMQRATGFSYYYYYATRPTGRGWSRTR